MRQGYSRVIVLMMVVAALSVPQGKAQDAGPSGGEAQREVLERQSVGLEETLTLAAAHTSAGQFAEGQQVLETALRVLSTPQAQHALRLALADLHEAWAHQSDAAFCLCRRQGAVSGGARAPPGRWRSGGGRDPAGSARHHAPGPEPVQGGDHVL